MNVCTPAGGVSVAAICTAIDEAAEVPVAGEMLGGGR
jgi:hypothetical protein